MNWIVNRLGWLQQRRIERNRLESIVYYHEHINDVFAKEHEFAHGPDEHNQATLRAVEKTKAARFEMTYYQQLPLMGRAIKYGIAIPDEYILEENAFRRKILTFSGEAWVHHQLRLERRTAAKEWVAILSPILSLLVASLSLLIALKKK